MSRDFVRGAWKVRIICYQHILKYTLLAIAMEYFMVETSIISCGLSRLLEIMCAKRVSFFFHLKMT